jgi:transposase
MKKQGGYYFGEEKSILFDPKMMAAELKQLVKKYFAENKKSEIICLAEEVGHKVLYTFFYCSDKQPIELTWAYTKDKVGRQYSINTTLEY